MSPAVLPWQSNGNPVNRRTSNSIMPYTPYIALAIGVLLTGFYGWMWKCPEQAHRQLEAYPRSSLPAQVLLGITLIWFAWNLWQVDFGPFSKFKNLLYGAVPLGYYLIWTYTRDLLAVRTLCFFLLLAGNPLLIETRWHGSPAQFAVGILVYLVMIKSMVLVVYPHLWKRGVRWMYASASRARTLSLSGVGVGAVLILCALISF